MVFQSLLPSPLVVDMDPTYPGLEVIVGTSYSGFGIQLVGYHADGSYMQGWTIEDWYDRGNLAYAIDTISTID